MKNLHMVWNGHLHMVNLIQRTKRLVDKKLKASENHPCKVFGGD